MIKFVIGHIYFGTEFDGMGMVSIKDAQSRKVLSPKFNVLSYFVLVIGLKGSITHNY